MKITKKWSEEKTTWEKALDRCDEVGVSREDFIKVCKRKYESEYCFAEDEEHPIRKKFIEYNKGKTMEEKLGFKWYKKSYWARTKLQLLEEFIDNIIWLNNFDGYWDGLTNKEQDKIMELESDLNYHIMSREWEYRDENHPYYQNSKYTEDRYKLLRQLGLV